MSFHLWPDVSVVLAGGFTGVTSGSKHSPAGKMHQIKSFVCYEGCRDFN